MKKEIEEQIGKDWEEVNSQLQNGVNPHAYRLGYLKGYQKALEEIPTITAAQLKNLLSQHHKGEISFSRMVELLNAKP